MKILFCAWNIVGEADMIAGLRRLGHQVEVLARKIKSVDYDLDFIKELSGVLDRMQVDCIFTTDFVPAVSKVSQIYKLPYISWTVDCPTIMLASKAVANPCNYLFLFDQNMYERNKDKNPGHIFYMPLGGNVERMDKVPFAKKDQKEFAADVSFVGSLYYEKSRYNMIASKLSPYVHGYAEALIEAQLLIYGENLFEQAMSEETAEKIFEEMGILPLGEDCVTDKFDIITKNILPLQCTYLERVRMLNAIAEHFDLDLYTKQDAEQVPKANYRGTVDYNTEMLSVFRASKINLNFTSKSIQTGIPLRIFDILGAGGFLITNYQTELPEYFEIGKELVCYESKEDLLYKIDYYLQHEDERKTIAENGYQKVKQYMQMHQRLEDIFAILDGLK